MTVHLASAVGLIGVDLVLVSLGLAGWQGSDPETIYPAMYLVARGALVPLAVLALVTGVVQGLLSNYGLLRHWWVTAKLAITLLLTVVAIAVVAPGLGRTADAAISTGDAVTTAQQATSTLTPVLAGVLLLFMVVLGVFKPGRRRKPRDRPDSRPAG